MLDPLLPLYKPHLFPADLNILCRNPFLFLCSGPTALPSLPHRLITTRRKQGNQSQTMTSNVFRGNVFAPLFRIPVNVSICPSTETYGEVSGEVLTLWDAWEVSARVVRIMWSECNYHCESERGTFFIWPRMCKQTFN